MATDPFNQLPTNADWLRLCEEKTQQLGRDVNAHVVLIAIQPGGKMACFTGNEPTEGPIFEAFKDMPQFFMTLANIIHAQAVIQRESPAAVTPA